jgi:flagellar motor switch protein FliM
MVQTLDRDARVTSPVLEEVFAGAARRLRARLATRVGSDTPVRVTDVRVTMLQELLEGAEYADGALWVTFTTEGHDEPCVVAMEGRLVARLIGRMLGDAATDLEDYTARTVTEVELAIGSRICREFLDAVEQCWTMSVPPRFRYVQAAPSRRVCADLDGELSMSVTVVDVAYAGSVLGSIFVALPMQLVRRLIPRAAAVIPGASGRAPPPPRASQVYPALHRQRACGIKSKVAPSGDSGAAIYGAARRLREVDVWWCSRRT